MRFHIEWHTARQRETFIGNMELRSLTREQYDGIVGLRKDYEAQVRAIVADGRKSGAWDVDDVRVTTLALLSLLTGISVWYREGGRLRQERLIRIYQRLALRMLGATG